MTKIQIYDIESFKNFFCCVLKDTVSGVFTTFEISCRKDERKELIQFVKDKNLVGFNNINYDYPLLHWIMRNYQKHPTRFEYQIYVQSQNIIHSEYSAINSSYVLIPQLDLYRIWHFNNKNKATSLKALEIAMEMENVIDLPLAYDAEVPEDSFDMVIEYCKNDVNATYKFYKLSSSEIKLRCQLSREYGLDLYNANDPKIGEEIFLHELSKEMAIDKSELRKMRSPADELIFENYILDYIAFKTEPLQDLLSTFKKFRTTNTKGEFEYTAKIGDFEIDYAQGGLHGCIKPGIYESSDDIIIVDVDVASMYPNIAIANTIRPKHLGDAFSKIYNDMFERRKTFDKKDPRNKGLKLSLNGSFGKMNDKDSFLYDPESLLRITLNGQLLLTMLIEEVFLNVKVKFLQGNTDGFTFMCNKIDLDKIKQLVADWEKTTGLVMEFAFYKSMIIRDVNNYIALKDDGKPKCKGCFKTNEMLRNDVEWHKNFSQNIVPLALIDYFTKQIPIRTTIDSSTNILDFCKRGKAPSDSYLVLRQLDGDLRLQKNNRYYVSKTGSEIIKVMPPLVNEDGTFKKDKLNIYRKKEPRQTDIFQIVDDVLVSKERETSLEAGYKCTLLNKLENQTFHLQQIDKEYYIKECYKVIDVILNNK